MVSFSEPLPLSLSDPDRDRDLNHDPPQLSGMFSYLSGRREERDRDRDRGDLAISTPRHSSWGEGRSLWTKYCLLCTACGSAATILAGIFLVIAALFRYYTTSINYFETVPTYIPAILLSICGVSTITFSCKRNRNIILLRITACWSLLSAAISSVITITTSLIHMNRLQTLKECVYNTNTIPPACSCYSHVFPMATPPEGIGVTYVFENTPDCEVIHGILYSCLRAVFAISVVAVLLSIFLCMLLYQLIGHERKKAYWSRIRRINSDWSADFVSCLSRDRSSVLPLMVSPPTAAQWGPPPPYEEVPSQDPPRPFLPNRALERERPPPAVEPLRAPLRLVTSHSENSFSAMTPSPHPFSPTITSIDPIAVFRHHHSLSSGLAGAANATGGVGAGNLNWGIPSMNSITSLSFPSTLLGESSTRFSSYSFAEATEIEQDETQEANTCRSVTSFDADSLEMEDQETFPLPPTVPPIVTNATASPPPGETTKRNSTGSEKDMIQELTRQIQRLEKELSRREAELRVNAKAKYNPDPDPNRKHEKGEKDEGLSVPFKAPPTGSSLPSSPFMSFKRGRLFLTANTNKDKGKKRKRKRNRSAGTLSFENINYGGPLPLPLTSSSLNGCDVDNDNAATASSKGSSLPSTPIKKMFGGVEETTRIWKRKLSLDEDKFVQYRRMHIKK